MHHTKILIGLLIVGIPLVADEVRTLGGKNLTGAIVSINDSDIVVKTETGPVSTPLAQVLAVNIRAAKPIDPAAKYTDIRLIDDTVLHCKSVVFQPNQVELTLLSGVVIRMPLNSIVSLFRDAQNGELRTKFEAIASKRLKRDRIIILRDGVPNPVEGTLGDIDAKAQMIKFKPESTGKDIDVPFDKVHGFIYYRSEAPSETPICRVYDTDGNSLTALKLTHDGTKLTLTTTFGAAVTLPHDALARLDFNLGKLTYLSDMEPAKVVEKILDPLDSYRRDTFLNAPIGSNQPIVLVDKSYTKGLSLHAHTELEYKLASKYKEFKAILGVDTRAGANSQARVSIYCDGVEQFSEVVDAKKLRPVAINVKDVGVLRIVVSSRSVLDLHDHASLAEARVSQ